MLLEIENLLSAEEVADCLSALGSAQWGDGRVTAGYQSAKAKNNLQLPEDGETARRLGQIVLAALGRNLLFQAAALPQEIFPPLFNRYDSGHGFGTHVDNAIRPVTGQGRRIRTDLSATIFLSAPDTYDGGELVIEDAYGAQSVKLAAGSMILYPSTSLHSVRPVTRGSRLASFFWVQSLVQDDGKRSVLFDMDISIQRLRGDVGDEHPSLIALTGCYHNLLRRWAIL